MKCFAVKFGAQGDQDKIDNAEWVAVKGVKSNHSALLFALLYKVEDEAVARKQLIGLCAEKGLDELDMPSSLDDEVVSDISDIFGDDFSNFELYYEGGYAQWDEPPDDDMTGGGDIPFGAWEIKEFPNETALNKWWMDRLETITVERDK